MRIKTQPNFDTKDGKRRNQCSESNLVHQPEIEYAGERR